MNTEEIKHKINRIFIQQRRKLISNEDAKGQVSTLTSLLKAIEVNELEVRLNLLEDKIENKE